MTPNSLAAATLPLPIVAQGQPAAALSMPTACLLGDGGSVPEASLPPQLVMPGNTPEFAQILSLQLPVEESLSAPLSAEPPSERLPEMTDGDSEDASLSVAWMLAAALAPVFGGNQASAIQELPALDQTPRAVPPSSPRPAMMPPVTPLPSVMAGNKPLSPELFLPATTPPLPETATPPLAEPKQPISPVRVAKAVGATLPDLQSAPLPLSSDETPVRSIEARPAEVRADAVVEAHARPLPPAPAALSGPLGPLMSLSVTGPSPDPAVSPPPTSLPTLPMTSLSQAEAALDQLSRDIVQTAAGGRVQFQLSPRHLGPLDVNIDARPDAVAVEMMSPHLATSMLITAARADLQQDLASHGLKLMEAITPATSGSNAPIPSATSSPAASSHQGSSHMAGGHLPQRNAPPPPVVMEIAPQRDAAPDPADVRDEGRFA